MNTEQICHELSKLADTHEQSVISKLPTPSIERIALFIELVRACDMRSIFRPSDEKIKESAVMDDILRMGWNLATSYLLCPLEFNGFPMGRSDESSQQLSMFVLYNLGCCVQIRRTVDMIKAGFLNAEIVGKSFFFRKTGIADNQHVDMLEYSLLAAIEKEIIDKEWHHNWDIVISASPEDVKDRPGNSIGIDNRSFSKRYLIKDIEKLMLPLVSTWSSKNGPMVFYHSSPEIDAHFMATAVELVDNWQADAGIHPDAKIGSLKGSDLIWITVLLVSFNLKHAKFTQSAAKTFHDVLLPESATIWQMTNEVIEDIANFTQFEYDHVKKAMDLIMFDSDDAAALRKHSSLFMPLLISLGNGYMIRPVSAIGRNPFYTIISLLEQRDSNIRHNLSSHREAWQRIELYAQFQGNRYQRTEGNINLRENGKVVTDIDAAVFDNMTGELALFQIKWQDYFFNDVKKLRSKASNLARELDEWAQKVINWLENNSSAGLRSLLRLKGADNLKIKSIYLFGISRNTGRTSAYGFERKSKSLAIANWAQFKRNRIEIGPTSCVLSTLFHRFKEQEKVTLHSTPIPVKLHVQECLLIYEDLWYTEVNKKEE